MMNVSIPWRSRAQTGSRDAPSASQITSTQESAQLRELNQGLQILVDIFPDVQPEVFREMLLNFSVESRIQLITEALLKDGGQYIRGRHRTPQDQVDDNMAPTHKYKQREQVDSRGQPMLKEERFRDKNYREAVRTQLFQEFKSLSHSTIRAVIAEYNFSYTRARPTLIELNAKSWKHIISQWFGRKKAAGTGDHPLVRYIPDKAGGPPVPTLVSTKNFELDMEIYDTLIAPIHAARRAEQVEADRELAERLNEEEAEAVDELYDCGCCYIPHPMTHMSACDGHGHYICYTCIRRTTTEALYGQGWARSINLERTTLRCMAAGDSDCQGCIPVASLEIALTTAKDGQETYEKLLQRFTTETLLQSSLPLIQCPFCPYAEIDTIALSDPPLQIRLKYTSLIPLSLTTFSLATLYTTLARFLLLFIFFFLTLNYLLLTPLPLFAPLHASLTRLARKRHGLKFTCLNPTCARTSCLTCHTAWHDIHICHERALLSLRTMIERATTDAIKRVCPACNTSFVKDSGCNKMRCTCGYTMCYVCREKIGNEGYGHFCQHFRPRPGVGGGCRECDKCDLYRVEDEDVVVRKARERAEREWVEKQEGKEEGASVGIGEWEAWLDGVLDAILA